MRTLFTLTWFALAVWFAFGGSTAREDVVGSVPRAPELASGALLPGARAVLGEPPMVLIGGVQQRCSDCHDIFASLEVTPSKILQHEHIQLNHGLNDRCYNCHSQQNRDRLVLRDGAEIDFTRSSELCSQCHGTVYRDWERGMHGRTLVSWDPSRGRVHMTCVGCHDAHAPAFGAFQPLPGPRVWRGSDEAHYHDYGAQERNPLERWKSASGSQGSTQ